MILLLALLLQTDHQEGPDHDATFKKLRDDYVKAETEYYRPYREARTAEERSKVKLDPAKHPAREFQPKFVELAGGAKGTSTGAAAWIEALRLASMQQMKKEAASALDSLLTLYIDHEVLESLPGQILYSGWLLGASVVDGAMATLAEKSPHAKVRASATYYRAYAVMNANNGGDPKGEARKLLNALVKDFAETPYAKRAAPLIYELENLQIGMTAPDFDAVDEKGVAWKLSDYRGKVVVIDFWGFW